MADSESRMSQPYVIEESKGSEDAVPGTTTIDADGNLPRGKATVTANREREAANDEDGGDAAE